MSPGCGSGGLRRERALLRAAASSLVLSRWHHVLSAWRFSGAWLSPGVMWSISVASPLQRGLWVAAWHACESRWRICWRSCCQLCGSRERRVLVSHAIAVLLACVGLGLGSGCFRVGNSVPRPGPNRLI